MKYLLIITIILAGCSDQWYLKKALQKNPDILDTKYDSTTTFDVNYSDTTYYFIRQLRFKALSDTAHVRDSISKGDTLRASSDDSTAHAEAYYDEFGLLNLRTWSLMDTVLAYKDSLKVKNKTINRKDRIIEKKEATINEKTSFISKLKTWFIAVLCLVGVVLIIIVLKSFVRVRS